MPPDRKKYNTEIMLFQFRTETDEQPEDEVIQNVAFSESTKTMTSASSTWHLLGAGNMGVLVIDYLQRAGMRVRHIGDTDSTAHETLYFADGRIHDVPVTHVTRHQLPRPIERLVVACKTPFTESALAGLPLADDACVLRLQNGIGSLDGLLGTRQRLIEGVTTNAVMRRDDGARQVVAENQTWIGPGLPDAELVALQQTWPGLEQVDDIRRRQWQKLVANAAINPLTAIFDVPNGALVERPPLRSRMHALIDETDTLLARLDPGWPADSRAGVESIARATAANTSSMRADIQRGQATEIQAINGWLIQRGTEHQLAMAAHREIVAQIERLAPPAA